VSAKPEEMTFKLQQEYTPKPMPVANTVRSLVALTLDKKERSGIIRYVAIVLEGYIG
jgi:hypothetical protein